MQAYNEVSSEKKIQMMFSKLMNCEIEEMRQSLPLLNDKEFYDKISYVEMLFRGFIRNDNSMKLFECSSIDKNDYLDTDKRGFQIILCSIVLDRNIIDINGNMLVKWFDNLPKYTIDKTYERYYMTH